MLTGESIDTALQRARRRNPTMERSIFEFVRSMLLPVSTGSTARCGASPRACRLR